MSLEPLYGPANAAFELRYSWTGWPSRSPLPADPAVLESLRESWERDGIRLLEHCWSEKTVQLALSTTLGVSPVFLASRIKGRLDHQLRTSDPSFSGFSRKVAVTSVGHNCREDVEAYIASQVDVAAFADPSWAALLKEYTVVCRDTDLSQPTESSHGRYWYNLHLVLVTAERYRVVDRPRLARLRDSCFKIAKKKGYCISRDSVMPDHLHVSLRGDIQHSPQEIALAFQNNLAYALGQLRIWADSFYVGTFGEYDMWAIRRNVSPH